MDFNELQRGCLKKKVSLFMYNMHLVVFFFYAKVQGRLADTPCAKNKLHCEIFTVDLVMTQQYLPHLSSSCLLKSLQKRLRRKDAILCCTVCDPRIKIHPSGHQHCVCSVDGSLSWTTFQTGMDQLPSRAFLEVLFQRQSFPNISRTRNGPVSLWRSTSTD